MIRIDEIYYNVFVSALQHRPRVALHWFDPFGSVNFQDICNVPAVDGIADLRIIFWDQEPVYRDTAKEFFDLVRAIFENWPEFRKLLKFAEDYASTDVVYAMAAQIIGPDRVTLPAGLGPTIVHMKRHINGLQGEDWARELIWESNPFRINTIAQWGFVHYHRKEWTLE